MNLWLECYHLKKIKAFHGKGKKNTSAVQWFILSHPLWVTLYFPTSTNIVRKEKENLLSKSNFLSKSDSSIFSLLLLSEVSSPSLLEPSSSSLSGSSIVLRVFLEFFGDPPSGPSLDFLWKLSFDQWGRWVVLLQSNIQLDFSILLFSTFIPWH